MITINSVNKTSTKKNPTKKPSVTNDKKIKKCEARTLLDMGFIKFLDEPVENNSTPPKDTNNENDHKTQAEITTPFFHAESDLPKIREQNMKNYADLSSFDLATDARIAEIFPALDAIITAECAAVKYNREEQQTKIRGFYSIIQSRTSRILIHKFIRQIPHHTKEYYYRLALEFRLIRQKNFTKVFLQVLDILGLINPSRTPHVIRGSAGSCLVCYLLGITESDPIAENISLARFMHAARDDLPDIDMDFPHNQRDEIYARIFSTWPQRAARISNHVAYGEKTALRKIMKEHGITGRIPKDFELETYFQDPGEIEEIRAAAEELEGQFKHFSLHCGGIVIFDQAIPKEYYLQEIQVGDSESPTPITGIQINLNKDQVDDYAFIKIDILSNRGLSQLWDISNKPLLDYPQNDPVTMKLLADGRNIGLTYAESRAIGKAFRHIKPANIQDIAIALAIIRPAASANGQKMDFLRDFSNLRVSGANKQEIDRDYIIYDDDAIQVINRLLGCGESQADIYRKAFAKSKYRVIREFRNRLDLCHPEWTIEKRDAICDQLVCLQDYSFCKSHALSYARLVYALAYQKCHNPVKFWIASLNNCNSSYRSWVHFREAVAAGVELTAGRGPWTIDLGRPNRILPATSARQRESTVQQTTTARSKESTVQQTTTHAKKQSVIDEYFQWGFWTSRAFLPHMFNNVYYNDPKMNIASKKNPNPVWVNMCDFRGLIATHRICKTDRHTKKYSNPSHAKPSELPATAEPKNSKWITFVTLGIDNAKYVDIVLYGAIKLGKSHVIEGEGYWMDNAPENSISPWIKVKKWRTRYLAEEYPD